MSTVSIPYPPYVAPTESTTWRGGRPFLFTVARPNSVEPLYDVALALYVNPNNYEERMTKVKNVTMTYGGYVEFVWPDEFDSISASGSTGGFISPEYGLTAAPSRVPGSAGELSGRRGTLAYERFLDFVELFQNNGVIFDSNGMPAIRGRIIMLNDRGAFIGHFTSFNIEDEETVPFMLNVSWEFKVETTIYKISNPYNPGL